MVEGKPITGELLLFLKRWLTGSCSMKLLETVEKAVLWVSK